MALDSLITVRVEGQPGVEKKLLGLETALDTRHILDEGGALMFNRVRARFLQQVDPTGQPWPVSRAALWRQKTGRGGGTLFKTGKLWRGIQLYAIEGNSRAIGENVTNEKGFPYPLKHQFGIGIVQRVFLGFGDDDVQSMTELVLKRIIAGLTK